MSRRRSRLEIILSILSAVKGGHEKPTRIMYAVNPSWNPTKIILSDMMKQGLIKMRTSSGISKRRYTITERGVNMIDFFEKAKEILPNDAYLTLATLNR